MWNDGLDEAQAGIKTFWEKYQQPQIHRRLTWTLHRSLTYFFPDLEPICCSMSSSNCCFLTCIQTSQEAKVLQFQLLWWRTDSLEKTLKLGKIEGRRRWGRQRMKRLDGIKLMMDREAWRAALHQVTKRQTQLRDWIELTGSQEPTAYLKNYITKTLVFNYVLYFSRYFHLIQDIVFCHYLPFYLIFYHIWIHPHTI